MPNVERKHRLNREITALNVRLNGVENDHSACGPRDARDFIDRLDHAGLIVGMVERDERQPVILFVPGKGRFKSAKVYDAVSVDTDARHGCSVEPAAAQKTGMVRCADVKMRHADRAAPHPPPGREQRGCGFGRARSERHVVGLRVDQRRHAAPRVLDNRPRRPAFGMDG